MPKHLQLVESDFETIEKKKLPRFPFCYLTFKSQDYCEHVFEVRDISHSGMQVELKNGLVQFKDEQTISGKVHWAGVELTIEGRIKWLRNQRMGIEFSHRESLTNEIQDFLNLEFLAKQLKPVHQMNVSEYPPNLKYWMRADGPVEIFIWRHNDNEMAHFEFLIMENFIEWKDGEGLRTGRVMSKRDLDSPLLTEDEFVFRIDDSLDAEKIDMALTLVNAMIPGNLEPEVIDFLKLKLS